MENELIINKWKYTDGLISIHNLNMQRLIIVNLTDKIVNSKILCQELGEILHYISTFRPNKIILSLDGMNNFLNLYENVNMYFFKILQLLGVNKIAFVSVKTDFKRLKTITKNSFIQTKLFISRDESLSWILM